MKREPAPEPAPATGSDSLTDDDQELWFGAISVGTPASTFTGSYSILLFYYCTVEKSSLHL